MNLVDSLTGSLIDALGMPAWLQQGTRALRTNEALQHMLGVSNGELCGSDFLMRISPDGRLTFLNALDECFYGSGSPPDQRLSLVSPDHTLHTSALTIRRVPNTGKEDPIALITCEPLKERKLESGGLLSTSGLTRQIIDGAPVACFVIDAEHRVTHWNCACEHMTARTAEEMIGTRDIWRAFYLDPRPLLADMIVDKVPHSDLIRRFGGRAKQWTVLADAYEVEAFFPHLGPDGQWLYFTAAPLRDEAGEIIGAIETLQDVTTRHKAQEELTRHRKHLEHLVEERSAELAKSMDELRSRFFELQETNRKLEEAQNQLLQSDKMASIGQLAAGIAHEINNPVGFVNSNLNTLKKYVQELMGLVSICQPALALAPRDTPEYVRFSTMCDSIELEYLKDDLPQLLNECTDGLDRVRRIVQDLKDFSRVDHADWQVADLNAGVQSTLNVVRHELKYKADVVLQLGHVPPVLCLAGQLNQVFLNLIVNAAHAIADRGVITLSSGCEGQWAWVQVDDTGCGMSEDVMRRIFEPFYTTKEVGKGTGLGLSLSFSIVQKHAGKIEVQSTPGVGSSFKVIVPISGPRPDCRSEKLTTAENATAGS